MHMSDALISPAVGGAMMAVSICAITYSVRKLKEDDEINRKTPLMGVLGAFVFAGQMLNFSIPGTGSSGHIGGALLLSALLGKHAGFLTLSVILLIQALFFADGGLLALGCNIFNLGFVVCFIAYPLVFKPVVGGGEPYNNKRITAASVLAAVAGLQIGSLAVVLETVLSGKTELPFNVFIMFMQPVHLVIGLCEGFITAGLLAFLNTFAKEAVMMPNDVASKRKAARFLIAGLILVVLLGGVLSMYASSLPDGLEWSVENAILGDSLTVGGKTHETAAEIQKKTSFLPDYGKTDLAGIDHKVGVSGIIGSAVTLAAVSGVCALLAIKRRKT